MEVGVPKEIKDQEYRVGLTPTSAHELSEVGHRVFVETAAGLGSGFADQDYLQAGAKIVATASEAWSRDLVIKVKEPLPTEYGFLRADQILFTYLHLAANRELTEALLNAGGVAIAYESVELTSGEFPLLSPMSVIAGRLAIQFGAHFLERQRGGRGVLLSGIPGVASGHVVILGGGVVGTEAARIAIGMGALVTILDINVERLKYLETLFGYGAGLLYSTPHSIAEAVPTADLLVGAVLVPGKRPPTLVSRQLVQEMRPGSVIVDVAVDQGGCIETLQVTSHSQPTYVEAGVIHCGVPNMPGAVPWTSTQALNHSTLPYILQLADQGLDALGQDAALAKGLVVKNHQLLHPAVQDVFPDLVG